MALAESARSSTARTSRRCCRELARYPEVLLQAAAARAPHALVHYLRELANCVPHLVQRRDHSSSRMPPLRNARLALAFGVQQVLANGLALLGVSAPESM